MVCDVREQIDHPVSASRFGLKRLFLFFCLLLSDFLVCCVLEIEIPMFLLSGTIVL